ncbi:MAG TPA: hypothetical protein P5067_01365 [Candidatus Marinimicrobia bacterium]|nr:hypothetical protein [Candidatus Neomarinimicrobiota bacterium]HRS51070.1 hypothetical protein [Candidatus Neomarinimicrobiota bacterium]
MSSNSRKLRIGMVLDNRFPIMENRIYIFTKYQWQNVIKSI